MLVFCACGSERVGIKRWQQERALFVCHSCGQERWVEGFTMSEVDLPKFIIGALVDQARKHRQRDPTEVERLMAARREEKRLRGRR